jgi:hypothetical protein
VPGWTAINAELLEAHQRLANGIARLRTTADRLGSLPPIETVAELRALDTFLTDDLLPHEQEEDDTVHPALALAMGNDEATAAFHGTHNEIYRLARIYRELVGMLPPEGPEPEDLAELRRVLYGLHAILRLHQSQEEELYASVADPAAGSEGSTVSRPAPDAPGG